MSVRARREGESRIVVDYSATAPGAVGLQLALAQDRAETHVTRGENAERLLRHRHVVRAFESVPLPASGSGSWRVPVAGLDAQQRWFVAAYATDPSTLAVLGAASYTLESAR